MNRTFTLKQGALDCIRAANVVAPSKDVRYYLNCVLLDLNDEQPWLIATDGDRLTRSPLVWDRDIECDDHTPGQYLITKDTVDAMKQVKSGHAELLFTDTITTLFAHGGSRTFPAIDGKFPDWRRVIPAKPPEPTAEIGFRAEHVADLLKWRKALPVPATKGMLCIRAEFRGPNDAVLYWAGDHLQLIMPTRL